MHTFENENKNKNKRKEKKRKGRERKRVFYKRTSKEYQLHIKQKNTKQQKMLSIYL